MSDSYNITVHYVRIGTRIGIGQYEDTVTMCQFIDFFLMSIETKAALENLLIHGRKERPNESVFPVSS